MISTNEADQIIHANLYQPSLESIPIEESVGRVLAQEIIADRPFPPFNRVSMDGIAILFENYKNGQRKFRKVGIAPAGSAQKALSNPNDCIEVMTGAILPVGVDTVVRYEDINEEDDFATITIEDLTELKNVHHEGSDRKKGEVLLAKGKKIGPAEIGVFATVGHLFVNVYTRPKVAIITTGDELVDISMTPKLYQIRKSNNVQIKASIESLCESIEFIHLSDNKNETAIAINECLDNFDVLILSGGVSKGKFDYVPDALKENNVDKLFYKVAQRPGKPFWFGRHQNGTTVFALPGNPVSSFMCSIRYIVPWLHHSSSRKVLRVEKAVLGQDFNFEPPLTYFLQVKTEFDSEGRMIATPIPGRGSGDLANLNLVDGFLELPDGRSKFKKGEVFHLYSF